MPTNEFKPGDKVICIENEGAWGNIKKGEIYTIKKLGTGGWSKAIYLESDKSDLKMPYFKWRFKKVQSKKRINYRDLLKKRK